MNNTVQEILNAIETAKDILIIPHINPDGDCIGSASALAMFLKNEYKKNIKLLIQSKVPEIYKFLNLADSFEKPEEIKEKVFDTVISVDCASKDRMTTANKFFDNAKITVNIDHHLTNPHFGKLNYVYGDLSSTGEVLHQFAKAARWTITKDIANSLYVAILTDTGGFKHENTKASTFLAVADLMKYDISPSLLYRCCYESKPMAMVKLNAYAVAKSTFLCNGKIAYTIITLEDMKKNQALNEHTKGIVEILRQVNSVEVAFVIKETDEGFSKISLRSKEVDVSKIAMKFNGGGHIFASGCTIKKHYNTALSKLLDVIKEELNIC